MSKKNRKKQQQKSDLARSIVTPKPKKQERLRSAVLWERGILLFLVVTLIMAFTVFGLRNLGGSFFITTEEPEPIISAIKDSENLKYTATRRGGVLGYADPTWRWERDRRIEEIESIAKGQKVAVGF